MAYKQSSIDKFIRLANEWYEYYSSLPLSELKICESKGNSKIGKTFNYSLSPLLTCGKECKVCMHDCYDIKACLQYSNVLKARVRNTVLALKYPDEYFRQIDESLSRKRSLHPVRFHVGGDIPSYEYFCKMVELARKHKERFFWTYTKKYWLVNAYVMEYGSLPDNFVVMFSKWDGLKMENPFEFPEFYAVDKGIQPANNWKCPGKCGLCIQAKRGCIAAESSYIEKH